MEDGTEGGEEGRDMSLSWSAAKGRKGGKRELAFVDLQTAMSSSQDYANVAGGSLKLKGAGGSKK